MNEFIGRLKDYMNKNGLTQSGLSDKLGINRAYLNKVIKGNMIPNVDFFEKLSRYTNKSINWWLHGENDYKYLYSLNTLIDTFIEKGFIRHGEPIEDKYKATLETMLYKEIEDKLDRL